MVEGRGMGTRGMDRLDSGTVIGWLCGHSVIARFENNTAHPFHSVVLRDVTSAGTDGDEDLVAEMSWRLE